MRVSVVSMIGGLALLVSGGPLLAEADLARGESLYASCAACHGPDAGGNRVLGAPRLSHLREVELVAQLEKFRNGQRGGEGAGASARQMAPMAAALPDAQALWDVSAYIASRQSPLPTATVSGDARLGGDYYNQFCGACHGATAAGNVALNSPTLAGSDDWYLVDQLRAFRDGTRGALRGDRTGRQMRSMAAVLPSEQALADVVAFIHSRARQQ
ncbi:MAG: c-type cytochrome [Parahaliea sp.]